MFHFQTPAQGRAALGGLVGDLTCALVGPNAVRLIIGNCDRPTTSMPPSSCSLEEFCRWYFRATPQQKQCVTTAAALVDVDLLGISLDVLIGDCCACYAPGMCNLKHIIGSKYRSLQESKFISAIRITIELHVSNIKLSQNSETQMVVQS